MITVINSPNQISSAYNQMIYKVSSNNTAQPNFNFVADVYVSGYTSAQTRLVYPVQPSSTMLQFDIGPVIKNYVTYDFIESFGHTIRGNTDSTVNYYVQHGEIYDVSGIPTMFPNQVRNPTSDYKSAINTVFDFLQFSLNVLNDYDVKNHRVLNSSAPNYWIAGQQKLISFLDRDRVTTAYAIAFLSASGSVIDSHVESISLPTGYNIFNYDLRVLMTLAGYPSGTPPAGTTRIRIVTGTNPDIATFFIEVDDTCSQFDTYRLHWLNQFGAFDTFNFRKATSKRIDVNRSQYKSILPLNYAKSDRLKTNYNTEIIDRINLQSDWVTDTESEYLQTLVESPVVFLENSDGSFTAVNITNPSYDVRKYLNGRQMFNVSIDMEFTFNRYRQSQ